MTNHPWWQLNSLVRSERASALASLSERPIPGKAIQTCVNQKSSRALEQFQSKDIVDPGDANRTTTPDLFLGNCWQPKVRNIYCTYGKNEKCEKP
jgi:hypothetical protein